MAGKIVGITVAIEGDNSSLVKSLSEVDKSLNSTKSALSDINKSLKLDPSNIALLGQKQELLTKQISQTSEKLKIMKQVAQDAAKGLEQGTVSKEQYAKLTAELAKTEKEMESLNKEATDNKKALEDAGSGASELQSKLQDVDKSLSNTEKALRSVDAALKLDPGNTELISQKQELLGRQIEQTKTKLDLMKESAVRAAEGLEKGTVSKEEYAKLTAEIASCEHELGDLEKAASPVGNTLEDTAEGAGETAEGLEKTEKSSKVASAGMSALDKATGGLASALMSLATNPITAVMAALTALVALIKKTVNEFKQIASTIKNVLTAACEAAADALETVVTQIDDVLKKLSSLTRESASYADNINTLAKKLDLPTEKVQELMYMADLTDVSVETLGGALTKLTKNMASAGEGTKSTSEAFKKLGVEIKNSDGTFRDQYDVMMDTISALSQIDDEVTRDATATTLFGKGFKDLKPLMKASTEEIEAWTKAAHDSGYVLSDEVLAKYQEFDDTMQQLDKGFESLQHGFGLVMLPLLQSVASDGVSLLNEFAKGVVDANGDIEKIGKTVDTVFPKFMQKIVDNLPQAVALVKQLITTFLTTINNNLPAFLDAGLEILKTICDGLLNPESIQNIMAGVTQIVTSFCQFLEDHGAEIIDLGVYVIVQLINGLSEALPKLIPAVADAIVTIVNALTSPENLDAIIGAALTLFEAIIDGLDKALPAITEALPGAIQRIADKLVETDMIGKIVDAGIKLFQSLLDSGVIDEVIRVLGENAGPIAELVTKIGTKFIELKFKLAEECTPAFLALGQQLCLAIADGIVSKIPFVGDKLRVAIGTISAMLPGGSAYVGGGSSTSGLDSTTPSYQHFDNNLNKNAGNLNGNVPTGEAAYNPNYGQQQSLLQSTASYYQNTYGKQAENITVNAYIGDQKMGTAVATAQGENNYISGGR
jgi:hypothetical protein